MKAESPTLNDWRTFTRLHVTDEMRARAAQDHAEGRCGHLATLDEILGYMAQYGDVVTAVTVPMPLLLSRLFALNLNHLNMEHGGFIPVTEELKDEHDESLTRVAEFLIVALIDEMVQSGTVTIVNATSQFPPISMN